jgi:hypothetical protein
MPIIRYILTYLVDEGNKMLIPLVEGEKEKERNMCLFFATTTTSIFSRINSAL